MDLYGMSNQAIILEIGFRLKQLRLRKNISQASLAKITGIHRVTLSKIEGGQKSSLITFIKILRGIEELERLDNIIPEENISPLQLAKLRGKERKRASKQLSDTNKTESEW